VTGGMLGMRSGSQADRQRGSPGDDLDCQGASKTPPLGASATSTTVETGTPAEPGESGMLASPCGSGGRLKIAPDIADQLLTPMPGCGFQFPKPPVL
jgi:hypothetical protein